MYRFWGCLVWGSGSLGHWALGGLEAFRVGLDRVCSLRFEI